MKAMIYNRKYAPELLKLEEIGTPTPADGEALVRIEAVSLNAADYRSIQLGSIPKNKIFGADVAGRVAAVGRNVQKLQVGDAVAADLSGYGFGGLAEAVAAPEAAWVKIPEGVSFPHAAAAPMAAATALQALRELKPTKPGQQVLVYGAGGGVGTFAVQFARQLGAEVTAVCGPNNAATARALGAKRVVDYTREDVLQGSQRFDRILAVNGSRSLLAYRRALKPGGVFVMIGGGFGQLFRMMAFGGLLSLGDRKMRLLMAKSAPSDLEYTLKLMAENKVTPVIDRRYPLHEAAQALLYVRQGHARGKVIIEVQPAA